MLQALLDNVRQFMGQQLLSRCSPRRILLRGENYIRSDCIGECIDSSCGFSGTRIGVDANSAEIMAKTRFHEGAAGRVERLTGRAQHFVNDRRNSRIVPSSDLRVPSFALQPLFATFLTFTGRARRAAAGAFAL